MTDRNIAMEIANALAKADSQTLAAIGFELLGSLGEARATIAARERKRQRDKEYQQDRRTNRTTRTMSAKSDDSLNGSPHPSLNPTSTSSSSARVLSSWQPADEAALAGRLPSVSGKNALTAVLAQCTNKRAVAAEIGMILDGGRPGTSMKPEHMELALSDYAANGLTEGRFNAAHFRRHVQRAASPEQSNDNGRHRGGVGNRSYENAKEALSND